MGRSGTNNDSNGCQYHQYHTYQRGPLGRYNGSTVGDRGIFPKSSVTFWDALASVCIKCLHASACMQVYVAHSESVLTRLGSSFVHTWLALEPCFGRPSSWGEGLQVTLLKLLTRPRARRFWRDDAMVCVAAAALVGSVELQRKRNVVFAP